MSEPTGKELDEAMKEMECWDTETHLEKCKKCQDKLKQNK